MRPVWYLHTDIEVSASVTCLVYGVVPSTLDYLGFDASPVPRKPGLDSLILLGWGLRRMLISRRVFNIQKVSS